jgi:hypothetical protein
LRRTALAMCTDRGDSRSGTDFSPTADERAVADTQVERMNTGERVLRLLIYQRDLNRRFTDLAALEGQLHTRNNLIIHGQPVFSNHTTNGDGAVRWEVSMWRHSEQASPCALIKALNRADVFLTAHGFQSTGEFPRMLAIGLCRHSLWSARAASFSSLRGAWLLLRILLRRA